MLGMTREEAIAYQLALRFTRAVKKVVEVQPVYLDDNLPDFEVLVYQAVGQSPFKGIKEIVT